MNPEINEIMQILIVDDDELFSKSLSLLLEDILVKKCSIEFAYSGNNALELLKKEHFDIVFLDNKLPDKNGLSLLSELRRNKTSTNVIFITGYGDEKIAVKAMKLGAVDYISKGSIDIRRLSESLNEVATDACSAFDLDVEVISKINDFFSTDDEVVLKQTISIKSDDNKVYDSSIVECLDALLKYNYVEKTRIFSTISCPRCNSLPKEEYLTCPICSSQLLEKGEVIEHNKCHHIDFRTNFINENDLFACPKCGDLLKQIGVDYNKVGSNYRCHNSHIFPRPEHRYSCKDCGEEFTETQAKLVDVYKYKLLEEGKSSLKLCNSVSNEDYMQLVNEKNL